MACTRAQPSGVLPKRDQAAVIRRSVSQYRAGQEEHQCVVGQLGDLMLACRRFDRIGQAGIRDQRIGGNFHPARRRHQPGADITECIQVARRRQRRRQTQLVGLDDVDAARGVHVEHQHHGRARHEFVGDLETDTDLHD